MTSLRQGIVVDTHPEDHSVDLVMLDDGSRMIGVQIMSPNGSTRSGATNIPHSPKKKDKWDITQRTGQDQIAVVAFVRSTPVIMGFLFPQVSQMTWAEKDRMVDRHASDVYTTISPGGDYELFHPSGAYIRISESPEHEDLTGTNFDKNFALDRNGGKKVHVRIRSKDTWVDIDPNGIVTVRAPVRIMLETPLVHATGNVLIDGNLSVGGHADIAEDCVAGGISVMHHVHGGVVTGFDDTGEPEGS